MEEYILDGKDVASNEKIEKHAQWVKEFLPKYDHLDKDNIEEVLHKEVGNVFVHSVGRCWCLQMYRRGQSCIYAFY